MGRLKDAMRVLTRRMLTAEELENSKLNKTRYIKNTDNFEVTENYHMVGENPSLTIARREYVDYGSTCTEGRWLTTRTDFYLYTPDGRLEKHNRSYFYFSDGRYETEYSPPGSFFGKKVDKKREPISA